MILIILCAGLSLPLPPKPYGFFIYYGPSSRTYTNKVPVGWPSLGNTGTNFQTTVSGLPKALIYFAVTVTNRESLESDYSNEIGYTSTNGAATLAWFWTVPNLPVTNIVIVSAGTNQIALTNPVPTWQLFRLHGLSWTNAVLQANWNMPPSWQGITVWNYSSNPVPPLAITRQ